MSLAVEPRCPRCLGPMEVVIETPLTYECANHGSRWLWDGEHLHEDEGE